MKELLIEIHPFTRWHSFARACKLKSVMKKERADKLGYYFFCNKFSLIIFYEKNKIFKYLKKNQVYI